MLPLETGERFTSDSINTHKDLLHTFCFACSPNNPLGLNLHFQEPKNNSIQGEVIVPNQFQGYNNIVHGGIISTILDAAMTNLLLKLNKTSLTVDLNIRFSNPMQLNETASVHAELLRSRSTLHELKAEIRQNDNRIAHAKARFMEPDNKKAFFFQNQRSTLGSSF